MRKRRQPGKPDGRKPGPAKPQAGDRELSEEVVTRFAEPFAKALAIFVREASQTLDPPRTAANGVGAGEQFVEFNDAMLADVVVARVRRLMRTRGITQAQLAQQAKLSPGVVSRALRDPDRAKLATLRKVAAVLDARFVDLLQPGSER